MRRKFYALFPNFLPPLLPLPSPFPFPFLYQLFRTLFLPARRYASADLRDSDVSVRLSVRPDVRLRHTPVLCLAERKQDREVYTV